MSTTQSKEKIEKAQELLSLIEKRKEIEDREADLKNYFKHEIGAGGVLEAGNVIILIEKKERSSLDKKAMEIALGRDVVHKFEKVTEYQQVTVKARAA